MWLGGKTLQVARRLSIVVICIACMPFIGWGLNNDAIGMAVMFAAIAAVGSLLASWVFADKKTRKD